MDIKAELEKQLEFLKQAQKEARDESDYNAVVALSESIITIISLYNDYF